MARFGCGLFVGAMAVSAGLLTGTGWAQATVALSAGPADGPVPVVSSSTVSGRVMFADTNGPARFSKVFLKSLAPAGAGDDGLAGLFDGKDAAGKKTKLSAEDEAERKTQLAASRKFMAQIGDMLVSATVAADGTYYFTNVKPGTYYVHAQALGYIDPFTGFNAEELASTDAATRAKIAVVVPTVTVTATSSGHADLRLERGGSIAGRVLYDDGTPAMGWIVRTVHPPPPSEGSEMMGGFDLAELDLAHAKESGTTDDTGAYRISGLPGGSYVLQARMQTSPLGHSSFNALTGTGSMAEMAGLKLTVYSGNAMRQAEAKPIEVRGGDAITGYEMMVPLHALHAVGGLVRAKSDGHAVSGGAVELVERDAAGKEDGTTRLSANIRGDGTFRFDYVAGPGTYTLKTVKAVDTTTTGSMKLMGSTVAEQKTTKSYGVGTAVVTVGDGDVTDLKVEVPEKEVGR